MSFRTFLNNTLTRVSENLLAETIEEKIQSGKAQFIWSQLHSSFPIDPNAVNRFSKSGAMLACIHNQPDVLQVYIDTGADLWLRDCDGHSAISHAILNVDKSLDESRAKWQCLDKLVGHLLMDSSDKKTARAIRQKILHEAAVADWFKTVQYVLRGDTYAAEREIYNILIEATFDRGTTLIRRIMALAVRLNHPEIKWLCEMAPEMLWEGLDLIKEVDHAINIPVSIDEWDGDKIMDVASDGIYQY